MDYNFFTLLVLAFGTGMLHALDADHVMAITSVASAKKSLRNIVGLCLKWSLGHGMTLLVLGSLIFVLGLSIPPALSIYAETGVAILLILLGIFILVDIIRTQAHLHFHQHDGLTRHAHWHRHNIKQQQEHRALNSHQHRHGAVLIGVVHGLAGFAPLIALLPLANKPVWLAMTYLLLFCLGVFISMLFFGGVLGKGLELLQRYSAVSVNAVRSLVALTSISLGASLGVSLL